jgi:hypothetical protein
MKLQQILTRPEVAALVLLDPICKRTVEHLKTSLSRHSLKGSAYHLIQAAESAVLEGRQVCGKSLHDISGNFLWCQKVCASLFRVTTESLLKRNVFDLMSRESIKDLNTKCGGELLADRMPKVISFYLKDQGTRLTARCSEAVYSLEGVERVGIMLETRKSRRLGVKELHTQLTQEVFRSPRSPTFPVQESKSYQITLPLKRRSSLKKSSPQYLYSPVVVRPIQKQEFEFSPGSLSFGDNSLAFSISPYLKLMPETSKQYSGIPNVSEFSG